MIKGINRKCNLRQKWNNSKYQCEYKILLSEDYTCNPSKCGSECDKDCDIGEYLKDCTFLKSLGDNLLVRCDKTVDTQRLHQSVLKRKQIIGLLLLFY